MVCFSVEAMAVCISSRVYLQGVFSTRELFHIYAYRVGVFLFHFRLFPLIRKQFTVFSLLLLDTIVGYSGTLRPHMIYTPINVCIDIDILSLSRASMDMFEN